jgi:hypothetical protein
MCLDTKIESTIIEDKSWLAKNWILSTMGSSAAGSHGSSSQRALLPVGVLVGSTQRSCESARTITQSSLQWSHLSGLTAVM